MKEKSYIKWLGAVSGALLMCWLLFGITPYLLHKSKWDNYSFGDEADWIASASPFYDLYYFFGVVGGWQYIVVASALCFYATFLRKVNNTAICLITTVIFSFLIVILIAVTRNSIGSVMRVLE